MVILLADMSLNESSDLGALTDTRPSSIVTIPRSIFVVRRRTRGLDQVSFRRQFKNCELYECQREMQSRMLLQKFGQAFGAFLNSIADDEQQKSPAFKVSGNCVDKPCLLHIRRADRLH